MKKINIITKLLLISMVLVVSILSTSCFSNDDEEAIDIEDIAESGTLLSIELPSDIDNGIEWTLEQSEELFSYSDIFLEDEGAEEGSGEVQEFSLSPTKPGSTTLKFTNTDGSTVYTYECQVDDTLQDVKVINSSGESEGEAVANPPEPVIERD